MSRLCLLYHTVDLDIANNQRRCLENLFRRYYQDQEAFQHFFRSIRRYLKYKHYYYYYYHYYDDYYIKITR